MNKTILRLAAVAIGGIFVYSGAVKLRDPNAFAIHIQAYKLLSNPWVTILATTLPIFELLTGLWLLIGRNIRPALVCTISMAFVFAVALISVKIRGLIIECGCFGNEGPSEVFLALVRDMLLLAISIPLYIEHLRLVSVQPRPLLTVPEAKQAFSRRSPT